MRPRGISQRVGRAGAGRAWAGHPAHRAAVHPALASSMQPQPSGCPAQACSSAGTAFASTHFKGLPGNHNSSGNVVVLTTRKTPMPEIPTLQSGITLATTPSQRYVGKSCPALGSRHGAGARPWARRVSCTVHATDDPATSPPCCRASAPACGLAPADQAEARIAVIENQLVPYWVQAV